MDHFPQLRVRTEFSFTRKAFGPLARIADRLRELGARSAGIVNAGGGTWGHAKFEKAMLAAGIEPMFGAEFPLKQGETAPVAWVLGEDIPQFYALCSTQPDTKSAISGAKGVIRFAGAAMDESDVFDYVDVSPRSALSQRRAVELARRTGKPLALISDNFCPAEADLDLMHAVVDRTSIGVQWLAAPEELRAAMVGLDNAEFARAVRGAHEIEERLRGKRIPKAPIISVKGDLRALCAAGKLRRLAARHIAEWTTEYEERLTRELTLIDQKQFESYFIVVSDLVQWAKARMLVGPARGSSAGSLVCYLTGITEVDPLVHGLLFERFIDVNRNDLPDIDIDFNDQKRDMVFDYLAEKYGRDKVARLGNINTLKATSVLNSISRRLGIAMDETFAVKNVMMEYSSGDARYGLGLIDTLQNTEPGRQFIRAHPAALRLAEVEGHATHSGVHAAGVIVCNEPITNFCTVTADGVAQIDKPDSEYLNMLKIDALGLRTLGIIEDAGCVTPEQLYSLTLDDPEVLSIFNQNRVAGVFQFEGAAQRSVASDIQFTSFKQLDHATALSRPGPLGGGAADHYIKRARGDEAVVYRHPSMAPYLKDTLGVVLYQEQVMRIVREIGNFSWEQTTSIRKAMSARKGAEFFDNMRNDFIAGAKANGMSDADGLAVWTEIFNFGAWGMNASHTVSYAIISYWCAWMKRYHPIEFAAATLRSAKSDEQAIDLLRELTKEGVRYVAIDPDLSEANWVAKNNVLVGGIQNAIGFGPAKAAAFVAARNEGRLTKAAREKLLSAEVKFKDLRPLHTAYGQIYADPQSHGIRAGTKVKNIAELEDDENAVIICRLIEKKQRDINENRLVKKRNGRVQRGQPLFLDLKVIDDSTSSPLIARVDRFMWNEIGAKIFAVAANEKDCFLIRGKKLKGFPMISVDKIRCLTNPEMTPQ